ncbi:hypothetical protein MKW92_022077 [Papaver armeniacum]|nr:hypothetical protein MKW92_022077 [Papaver armeniacum]
MVRKRKKNLKKKKRISIPCHASREMLDSAITCWRPKDLQKAAEHKHIEIDEEKEKSEVEVGAEESQKKLGIESLELFKYHDLSRLAKDISVKGKEYLLTVAEKSPEQVKDMKNVDKVPHFFLGILYGAFICLGGFLSFMLTGSISGIRFGTILCGALLALSILSMRSFKRGQSSTLALKGEAALFLKQIQIFKNFKLIIGFLINFIIFSVLLKEEMFEEA